jgi:methyl-accepting chemotaxis protein
MTFGRKIALGFSVSFALLVAIGLVAYRSTDTLNATSVAVTHTHQVLERIAQLMSKVTDAETGQRGFVITGDDRYLAPYESARTTIPATLDELRSLTRDNPAQQQRLNAMQPLLTAKLGELERTIALRRQAGLEPTIAVVKTDEGKKSMDELRRLAEQMDGEERALLLRRADDVAQASGDSRNAILFGTLACLVFVVAAGGWLTRTLTQQVGAAVLRVRSSSSELQAAAHQQASGARESATSMAEITTTISELMATSRQIADSAQRVTGVAQQTGQAASQGDATVQDAQASISGIRRQVDLVVNHMLDLGRKSQQIGAVLDIVSELAEQTNILAINATIEAAGAGESGRRFSVVAEEIRQLADRVTASTKEIRSLIDDVRGAVNTTVMTTETSSKAVDDGARRFGDVAASFRQIAALVAATTEAAREIELSTKQQASAVEQVNGAVADTANSTRESEASASQTLQTASELAGTSTDLLRLVQPRVT